jgi:uncharacterized protein YjbJ (UPF0337 family)
MSDRLDELKGNVKKGLGKLTGNQRLKMKGVAEAAGARARRETKGALRQAGGRVKEAIGGLTGRAALKAKGKAEQLRGKAERAG